MNKTPLITIVTVCFNAVSIIEDTILSVIKQTYPNIEYIIIDGGSSDGTVDIIKKYADKISYWVSESDKGIYDAMNKGIKSAQGEWVNFMNAGDTFYTNDTLLLLNDAFRKKEIDVIYGDNICMFGWGNYLMKANDLSVLEHEGMPFCHQTSFVRIGELRNFGFSLKYKVCADYNLFFQLYKRGLKFYYSSIIICRFDTSDGFARQNSVLCYKEQLDIRGEKVTNIKLLQAYFSLLIRSVLPQKAIIMIRKKKYSKNEHLLLLS